MDGRIALCQRANQQMNYTGILYQKVLEAVEEKYFLSEAVKAALSGGLRVFTLNQN